MKELLIPASAFLLVGVLFSLNAHWYQYLGGFVAAIMFRMYGYKSL